MSQSDTSGSALASTAPSATMQCDQKSPKARLRQVTHRGVVTAAMVYDSLPIIDVFRKVSDDVRLGAMDMRGLPAPFLFVLQRDASD